jgi:hypothetical protein
MAELNEELMKLAREDYAAEDKYSENLGNSCAIHFRRSWAHEQQQYLVDATEQALGVVRAEDDPGGLGICRILGVRDCDGGMPLAGN